jgi:hypothetical protein
MAHVSTGRRHDEDLVVAPGDSLSGGFAVSKEE